MTDGRKTEEILVSNIKDLIIFNRFLNNIIAWEKLLDSIHTSALFGVSVSNVFIGYLYRSYLLHNLNTVLGKNSHKTEGLVHN